MHRCEEPGRDGKHRVRLNVRSHVNSFMMHLLYGKREGMPRRHLGIRCPSQDLIGYTAVGRKSIVQGSNPRYPRPMRYYDLKRHWTRRIEPHLTDERLNAILVRDFNKFTFGN